MFSRFISRTFSPTTFQLAKAVPRCSKQCCTSYNNNRTAFIFNGGTHQRLYCAQAKPEEMTVDYDYVKKAATTKQSLIVDVREPNEIQEHGKIPNSINIPVGDVATVLSSMSEKDFQKTYLRPKPLESTEIIFYCMIGKRSGMAQQNALNLGYKNAKNYLGSWTDWANKSQK